MFKKKTVVIKLDPNIVNSTLKEDINRNLQCFQQVTKAFFEDRREETMGFELLDKKIEDKMNQIKKLKQTMAIKNSKTQRYISHLIRENNQKVQNMENEMHYMEKEYNRLERDFLEMKYTSSENEYFLNIEIGNRDRKCNMLSRDLQSERYKSAQDVRVLEKLKN